MDTKRVCKGNCSNAPSAGTLVVAGQKPLRFLASRDAGGVELVECRCGIADAEERGVVALLEEDKLAAKAAGHASATTPASHPAKQAPQDAVTDGAVASELSRLALGFFLARASWVIIKVTDSALLGHVSTEVLSATAVADLWMSSTGVVTFGGVLGTFVGNALGADNKKMAGVWLQVSLAVLMAVTVPVMILWRVTDPVLRALGYDEHAANAGFFASILALCLPARTVYGQLTQFFGAQKIVKPAAYVSAAGCMLNLFLGLVLVLGIFVPRWSGFGFPACPWTTVATEYAMLSAYIYYTWYLKCLHAPCWDGWDLAEITTSRILEFLNMYVPAAASITSDFWRVTAIGVFAARMGPIEIAVFNTSYRITWMTLTFVGSLGGALGTRLGIQLGAGDIQGGKQTMLVGGMMCCSALALLSVLVLVFMRQIASIFSDDQVVIEAFVAVRWPLSVMIFVMNFSVFLERIPVAMGRTKVVFYAGFVGSWVGQVPGVALALHFWRGDLVGLYWGVTFGYLLLCGVLIAIIKSVRWDDVVAEAKARSVKK